MGSLVAELAEKLSSATNNLDFDEQTMFLNTSADTVGIGTNNPASKLDVRGTMQVGVNDTGYDVTFFGDAAGAAMIWDTSANALLVRGATADHATDSAGRIVLQTNQAAVVDGDVIGRIDFQASGETGADALLVTASIWAEADDTFDATTNNTELVFGVASGSTAQERMRLDYAGFLGIGTSAPASKLHVNGTVQVGVDNTGHDVKFFGATSGDYMLWDEDQDQLVLSGTMKIKEQADADSDTAAFGQIWVNTATPNELYFTTDAGNDIQLTSGEKIAAPAAGPFLNALHATWAME